jgi:alpha-tubulin suppressor-like RCC1 family protein
VVGGHRYATIEARDVSTCAITTAERLLCWGRNGSATSSGTGTPTGMIDGVPVQAISVGMHNQSCAVGTDRVARCWGHNDWYQLGRGPLAGYDPNLLPVAGTQAYKGSISLGGFNGCALGVDDTTWCWGDMNPSSADGQDLRDRPMRVPGAPAFVQLEAFGSAGNCGRTASGEVWCWGLNSQDRLGPGAPESTATPVRVTGLPPAAYLDTGDGHACALTTGGEIWCWGGLGAFGEAWRTTPLTEPARFGGTRRFRLMATSLRGVCGVTDDDVAVCAGLSIAGTGL